MVRFRLLSIVVPALLIGSSCVPSASVERIDLLLGLGGFEHSTDFAWQSGYTGGNYDWNAQCAWVSAPGSSGWRSGYNLCKPGDTVATGWMRISGPTVNPALNQVYKLVDGQGISGSKAQYFALRNCTGQSYTILRHGKSVYPSLPHEPKPGDTVVFRMDSVRMAGYDSVPAGSTISASLRLLLNDQVFSQSVVPSDISAPVEVSGKVAAGTTSVTAEFKLEISADLTGKEVGIYVDGAHLYIKRAAAPSDYANWEIPAPKRRAIKTMLKFFDPRVHDIYETARSFDCILSGDYTAIYADQFRAINPQVKVFTYKTTAITKNDYEMPGKDPWYSDAGVQYNFASANHPEWFYSDGGGGRVSMPAYPRSYPAHLENATYQNTWAANVIGKMQLYGFDGFFMDDLNDATYGSVHIATVDCQKFLHGVMPKFRTAGMHLQRNGVMFFNYRNAKADENMGLILNNPFFATRPEYPSSSGYSGNTAENVSDSYFQEYAFFKVSYASGVGYTKNVYDQDFWWGQIQDMDLLNAWNTHDLLPYNCTKQMVMHSYGVNQAGDPAYGVDGWMQFALASYLLAQNDYTLFGTMDQTDCSILMKDYSITKRLGVPDGPHYAYMGDTYFRYRRYKATSDGGAGGVVVVNANTSASKTYTLLFNATDESGVDIPAGTVITLKPHTGRILLNQGDQLSVNIVTSNQSVMPGQTVDVTVEYSNVGLTTIKDGIVRASVPAQAAYVTGSAEKTGGSYDTTSNTVSWPLPNLPAGAGGTKTFQVRIW